MASPTMGTESVVAGYFQSGEDAHRAIQALLDEGFTPSQIGAAFHTAPSGGYGAGAGAGSAGFSPTLDERLGADQPGGRGGLETTYAEAGHGSGSSIGGPASDTTAVTPSGLAAGSGLPFAGIGREGSIPGAELTGTGLPSELRHELPHDNEIAGGAHLAGSARAPHTGSGPEHHIAPGTHHSTAGASWGEKLKHLFTPKSDSHTAHAMPRAAVPGVDSQNFGTGEGSLGLTGLPFSQSNFASSTTRAGVPAEHSRHLSHRLRHGGAVVTVSLTGRIPEVERIFEQHNGVVRFESSMFSDSEPVGGDGRVEVFGHLEHYYPES
jgi:hypothetical protein